MARKLIAMAALVALVSLASAGAVLAETYYLTGRGYDPNSQSYVATWTETYARDEYGITYHPGWANGEFLGGWSTEWTIGELYAPDAGSTEYEDAEKITYKMTYNSLKTGGGIGGGDSQIRFVVNILGLTISSKDLVVETTATYKKEMEGSHWYCYQNSPYHETMYGYGTNRDGDNTLLGSFTLTGTLLETQGDSNHYGYIIDGPESTNYVLRLEYSAVPLPAGVWLLGTGLLGLACLGRRRRK